MCAIVHHLISLLTMLLVPTTNWLKIELKTGGKQKILISFSLSLYGQLKQQTDQRD